MHVCMYTERARYEEDVHTNGTIITEYLTLIPRSGYIVYIIPILPIGIAYKIDIIYTHAKVLPKLAMPAILRATFSAQAY